ncbi:hypothetical protein GCM10027174_00290 [Salinifilum aidingensis]
MPICLWSVVLNIRSKNEPLLGLCPCWGRVAIGCGATAVTMPPALIPRCVGELARVPPDPGGPTVRQRACTPVPDARGAACLPRNTSRRPCAHEQRAVANLVMRPPLITPGETEATRRIPL